MLFRWANPDQTVAESGDTTSTGIYRPVERTVVIDTGPDFRQQILRTGIRHVDAVFYTHSHADHIFGLDDLRPLSFVTYRQSGPIPLYATPETRAVLERIYSYTFSPDSKYPTRARVALRDLVADRKPGFTKSWSRRYRSSTVNCPLPVIELEKLPT